MPATKRALLSETIEKDIENRKLSTMSTVIEIPRKIQKTKLKKRKQPVVINLDAEDYAILQKIAEEEGLTASALVRQGVKRTIRDYRGKSLDTDIL
jgi:hypothetical protein